MEIRFMPLSALGGLQPAAMAQAPPAGMAAVTIILIPLDQLQALPNGQVATIQLPPFELMPMDQGLPAELAQPGAMEQAQAQPAAFNQLQPMQAQPAPFDQFQLAPGNRFGQAAPAQAQPAMDPFQGWNFGQVAAPEPLDPKAAAQEVLKLVNTQRAKAGLEALAADKKLNTAAQKHSDDMAKRNYMAHVTPDGVDPFTRMANEGAQGIGENIAKGQQTAEEAVQAWMDDPPHRAAILNPMARTMGLGVADGDMRLWTQDFGVG